MAPNAPASRKRKAPEPPKPPPSPTPPAPPRTKPYAAASWRVLYGPNGRDEHLRRKRNKNQDSASDAQE